MGLANHSLTLKSNGEVWTWGYNLYGQLGDNTIAYKSSPILVVGSHSFVEISGGYRHTIARKANGEVWTWGWNIYGQLGDNTTASKSSPVLVVGSHNFASIEKPIGTCVWGSQKVQIDEANSRYFKENISGSGFVIIEE